MFGTPVILPRARLTRLAMLTFTGATALSVAACGASNTSKPATAPGPTSSAVTPSTPQSPSASPNGKSWVSGIIASISGAAIQVTQQAGTATVDFTPSTKITEVTPAQLTDVTAGNCVAVLPARGSADADGTITAQSVRVSPAVDGKCPEPKHPAGGLGRHRPVRGTVASVAGNTITVTAADSGGSTTQTTVTVNDTTTYTKETATDAQALAQGKCLAARGTKDDSGTLQATAISVQQADNGTCPQPSGRKHPH
ncbi:MAG: hypothetical protein JO082_02390 [Mycobacterium sp.]|nr:hypothetical protein [Mycobacterium sp.]MBV9720753.1 hypothetical protein [Mycobacterium sp.]